MGYGQQAIEKSRDIIQQVTEGRPLAAAAADVGLNLGTFHEVLSSVRELAVSYARAREIRADVLVDEALSIADTETDAQRARNMIDIRKWTASKHNQRIYGERVDLNVQQTLSISEALNEARGRLLLPISDPAPILDAEAIDIPAISGPEPTDSESVTDAAGPSIFD